TLSDISKRFESSPTIIKNHRMRVVLGEPCGMDSMSSNGHFRNTFTWKIPYFFLGLVHRLKCIYGLGSPTRTSIRNRASLANCQLDLGHVKEGLFLRISLRRSRKVYTTGITMRVRNVDVTRPPITATAMGARTSPPEDIASATGIIPPIMAAVVMRIGLRRTVPA